LLCLDARYAGVFAAGGQRLDRRFLKPSQWLAVERELIVGHPPGTLRSDSAIACALAGSGTIAIEALKRADVSEDSGGMIAALDRRLRESA